MSKRNDELTSQELFAAAMRGVKRLDSEPCEPSGQKPRAVLRPDAPVESPPSLESAGDRQVLRAMRRGRVAIDARLDLHGETRASVAAVVARFVADARRGGKRSVLIICGRGLNSPNGAVLKSWLSGWLAGELSAGRVVAFTEASADQGGAGAYHVFLRRA